MPRISWDMNINTFVTVAGFLLTLAFGYGAYTAFRAETMQQLADFRTQRAADVARMDAKTASLDAAVQNLSIQDARQIEQITAILSYLQRIERTLDTLVKDAKP